MEESARKRENKILILPHWLVKMLESISCCSIDPQPATRELQAALLQQARTENRTTEVTKKTEEGNKKIELFS